MSTKSPELKPENFTKLFLNGDFVEPKSAEKFSLRNPKDNTLLTSNLPVAGPDDVELAVKYAEDAMQGPWTKFTSLQRMECFLRLADLLDERLQSILEFDSLSSGNPVSLAPTRDRNYIINTVRYYAGWCDKFKGDYFPDDDGFVKLVRHEPLGVCAAINPFNAPVGALFLKACPALATGNVLIVKPSERTPFGTLACAPLFIEAGFPPGVLQVLTGPGSTGALLTSHMRIRKISFTGSIATGKKIQAAAAQSNLKRVTLELGGKSPAIIFEDCNLDNAITWTSNAILARSGQVCIAASRVYVQRSILECFLKGYAAKIREAANDVGDPQDPASKYGPLVNEEQLQRVLGMIERAKTQAELVVGGHRHGTEGCFVEPTLFVNPRDDAEVYREEVFGPVSVIKTFDTEEEVLRLANDTEYGLASGVFTRDINKALRISSGLDAGVVGVNCISYISMQVPFGGRKQSGLGREFGEYALRAYTEPKTVFINMNS